jgi:hypothetical protein
MSSVPGRAKKLESAISLGLLAVLLLISVLILLRHSQADLSRFGIEASAVPPLPQGRQETTLGSLAPSGFKSFALTETYTAGNLYEKINGKAGFYIDAGFLRLLTHRFINVDRDDLWMELYLYDMADLHHLKRPVRRPREILCRIARLLRRRRIVFGYETTRPYDPRPVSC